MSWTDDRIETLKHDWRDGFSASQIAARLGGVTRNAVIGKVHRLGLPGRATLSRHARSPQRRPCSRKSPVRTFRSQRVLTKRRPIVSRAIIQLLVAPGLGPPPPTPVTVQNLTASLCRWPEGDPKSDEFHFCGRIKSRAGVPYCDHHAAIAFR